MHTDILPALLPECAIVSALCVGKVWLQERVLIDTSHQAVHVTRYLLLAFHQGQHDVQGFLPVARKVPSITTHRKKHKKACNKLITNPPKQLWAYLEISVDLGLLLLTLINLKGDFYTSVHKFTISVSSLSQSLTKLSKHSEVKYLFWVKMYLPFCLNSACGQSPKGKVLLFVSKVSRLNGIW